jgi:DnaJ-class molecular chaperone
MMNFYDILQLNSNCSKQEIKQKYFMLAKQYHPDKNSAPDAKEKFIAIRNAYEILSDDTRRKYYDEMTLDQQTELYDILKQYFVRDPNFDEIYQLILKNYDLNEDDIKDDINNFNFRNLYNNLFYRIPIYKKKPPDLNIYTTIKTTLADKYMDKYKKITVHRSNKTKSNYIISLNNEQVVIKNAGEQNIGDAVINIICEPNEDFAQINEHDLYTIRYIAPGQTALEFSHLDGEILTVAPGTPVCLPNKGLPINADERGSLYIYFKYL